MPSPSAGVASVAPPPPSGHHLNGGGQRSTTHASHDLPYSPSNRPLEADHEFCNAFWSVGQRRRAANGATDDAEDWGKQGVETLWSRMRMGTKGLEDMRALLKERASIEDDYAKRIAKLSKHSFGSDETAHLERALLQAKAELEVQAKAHNDFAAFLRQQDAQIADFVSKRENARKTSQATTEKTWKSLGNQRNHVLKAKAKYEDDAITINALHAQASLLQGRDLDKAQMKLDKAQQTVQINERDYKNYVGVLKDTTRVWNEAWKTYCDISQDQEEERVDFVKCRVWDWANGISVVAMAEDEGAERLRTALEQCDAKTDIKIFVQQSMTGKSIPDPLPFVDFSQNQSAHKQTYKVANFKRSSTRIPGTKQTPLAVTDVGRAFQNAPESVKQPPIKTMPAAIATSQSYGGPGSSATTITPERDSTPTRGSNEPSRFAVSPSANLRGNSERPVSGSLSKAGHAPASAFQRSPSHSMDVPNSPARYEAPMALSAKENVAPSHGQAQSQHRQQGSKPQQPIYDDDDTDPILKALEKLNTSQSQAHLASPRSSADLRSRQSQPNLNSVAPGPSSRPRSPSATMMQPPAQQQPARPSSRQGNAPPNRHSTGQQANHAGVGARGRSPSPQPYHPDALRPHSPSPNPQRSSSPQPGPQNGFNYGSQQQQTHQQPPYVAQPMHQPQQHGPPPASYSQQFGNQQQFGSQPQLAQRGAFTASPASMGGHHRATSSAAPPPLPSASGYAAPPPQPMYAARARSPGPTHPQAYAGGAAAGPPPPPSLQQSYSQQFQQQGPTSPVPYGVMPQAYSSGYRSSPSTASISSPYSNVASPVAPQPFQSIAASPSNYAPSPAFSSPATGSSSAPGMMNRPPSTHSAVSSVSASGYAQPMYQQAAPGPQQPQHQRSASAVRSGRPPPSGQFTADGQPIEFFVNALHDYSAAMAEEFSFRAGDVIAVTRLEPDGWWHGTRVGGEGQGLFPSNFVEMIWP